tara:strand:+ start:275 stop:676 length:402 start_codon:yes stop_codon:yes gene_type:complete
MAQVAQTQIVHLRIAPAHSGVGAHGRAGCGRREAIAACGYPSRLLKTTGRNMDFADFGESYARRDGQFSSACVSNPGHAGSNDGKIFSSRFPANLREIRRETRAGSGVLRADVERSLTKKKRTDASFGAGRGE